MWMIDPKLLCNKHLLGEHGEIHKHRHVFERKYSIAGRRGQIEPERMKERHDILVAEMLSRGWKHKSPYDQPDLSYLPEEDREGTVDLIDSMITLANRCAECSRRFLLDPGGYDRLPGGGYF